jgi:hypothetical protein
LDQLKLALAGPGAVIEGAGAAQFAAQQAARKKNQIWFAVAPMAVKWHSGVPRSTTTLGDWMLDKLDDPAIKTFAGVAMGKLASLCQREQNITATASDSVNFSRSQAA